ncbi:MAG: rhomboid family protein [Phycisphaerae bacterium]
MANGRGQTEDLARKRCFNHANREAAARCPHCRRCFCRECVTEHDGRLTCAACLRKLTGSRPKDRAVSVLRLFMAGVGVLAAWVFFYYVGHWLLQLPSEFHQGNLWAGQ